MIFIVSSNNYLQSFYVVNMKRIIMTYVASSKLVVVFMAFALCRNLLLSANVYKKYPYWSDYPTDALQFKLYLYSPIDVLPDRLLLHETYGK